MGKKIMNNKSTEMIYTRKRRTKANTTEILSSTAYLNTREIGGFTPERKERRQLVLETAGGGGLGWGVGGSGGDKHI